jgi:hypothetical protein
MYTTSQYKITRSVYVSGSQSSGALRKWLLRDAPNDARERDILMRYLQSQISWLTKQIAQLEDARIELSAIEERKLVYTLEALLDVKRELQREQGGVDNKGEM